MMRKALFALAAVPTAAGVVAHGDGPLTGNLWPAPGARPGDIGFCVVNVGLSSVFMGKAGLAINAAVKTCPKQSPKNPITGAAAARSTDDKMACTASITGVITAFAYISVFSSAAAADCMTTLTFLDAKAVQKAGCAADTSAVIAGLSLIANAGTGVAESCAQDTDLTPGELISFGEARRLNEQSQSIQPEQERMLAELGRNHTEMYRKLNIAARRLGVTKKGLLPKPIAALTAAMKQQKDKANRKKDRPTSQAECAFNVGQATWFFARAGLLLNAAITDCSSGELFQGGNKQKAKCTAEVTRLILSLGVTGSAIANAVVQCPELLRNVQAACAGSIILVIAGFSDVLAASASFVNSCAALQGGRRLLGGNESSAPEYLV